MRRGISILLAACAATALFGGTARAQVFYSSPGARPVSDDSPVLGLVAGFGDHLFRVAGIGRFNASRSADIGIEFVYDDINGGPGSDDRGRLGAGADFKYLVTPRGENRPVDVAVQAGAGFLTRSEYTLIRIPLGAVASRSFTLEGDRTVIPYAGVHLIMDFLSVDTGARTNHDSNLDVELRMGASVEIVPRAAVFAALHAGNGTMFFMGFAASL